MSTANGSVEDMRRSTPNSHSASFWEEHRLLLALAFLYIAAGGFVQTVLLHRPWPIQFMTSWFGRLWLWGSTAWLISHILGRRYGQRSRLTTDQVLGAVLLAALAVPVQTTFQSLKQSLGVTRGFPWDSRLATIDRVLHHGPAWHLYSFVLDRPALLKAVDLLYVAWFVVLAVILVWLCWTGARQLRQRGLLALLMLWVGAGTVAAWVFASAGPCYRTSVDPDAAALMARLDLSHSAYIARHNQANIWNGFVTEQWLPMGGVSAMPSLHVGFAVLVAIIVTNRSRRVGVVLWAYAAVVEIGSVVLGWHYALDGYVGAASAWASWRVAGFILANDPMVYLRSWWARRHLELMITKPQGS